MSSLAGKLCRTAKTRCEQLDGMSCLLQKSMHSGGEQIKNWEISCGGGLNESRRLHLLLKIMSEKGKSAVGQKQNNLMTYRSEQIKGVTPTDCDNVMWPFWETGCRFILCTGSNRYLSLFSIQLFIIVHKQKIKQPCRVSLWHGEKGYLGKDINQSNWRFGLVLPAPYTSSSDGGVTVCTTLYSNLWIMGKT